MRPISPLANVVKETANMILPRGIPHLLEKYCGRHTMVPVPGLRQSDSGLSRAR